MFPGILRFMNDDARNVTVTIRHEPAPGIAYLLWLLCLVGVCGAHRFYTGRWVTGIIWLLTGGLLLFGQIVDLLLIPSHCRNPRP